MAWLLDVAAEGRRCWGAVAVAEVGLLPALRNTGARCTVARRGFRGPTRPSLQAAPKDMAWQRMRSCWSCEAPAYGKPVGERVREESSDRGNKNITCVYVYLHVKRNKNKHGAHRSPWGGMTPACSVPQPRTTRLPRGAASRSLRCPFLTQEKSHDRA